MVASASLILLLSDNERLARTITWNLTSRHWPPPQVFLLGGPPAMAVPPPSVRLIIVALSSSIIEPLVVLARTHLLEQVGRLPIIIISDHPFYTADQERLIYLEFPFDPAALCYQVEDLLGVPPQLTPSTPLTNETSL